MAKTIDGVITPERTHLVEGVYIENIIVYDTPERNNIERAIRLSGYAELLYFLRKEKLSRLERPEDKMQELSIDPTATQSYSSIVAIWHKAQDRLQRQVSLLLNLARIEYYPIRS